MSSKNLTINLKSKQDAYKNTYYVAKFEAPVTIDCSKGVTFLIFVSEKGEEELQIANMDKKDNETL